MGCESTWIRRQILELGGHLSSEGQRLSTVEDSDVETTLLAVYWLGRAT